MEIVQIDKSTLIGILKECRDYAEENYETYSRENFDFIIHLLNDIPTMQKEIHAKWNDKYRSGYKPLKFLVCSHCNEGTETPKHYCPRCGAEMNIYIEKATETIHINALTSERKTENELRKDFDDLNHQVNELGLEFEEWLDVEGWKRI